MEPNDLTLWRESAEAWARSQGVAGDESRRMLDPFVWEAVGPVAGRHVLDVGCGEGRFSRALTAAGARVTGLDPTIRLAARTGCSTVAGLGECLPFRTASFDLVLFYLVLVDICRFEGAIREAARVLKPGSKLVAVNLSPISTATKEPFWERDSAGRKTARRIEFYGIPQGQVYSWAGIRIRNYHRPLRDYIRAYLAAGLTLESYDEPMDTGVIADSVMSPNFDLMVWRAGRRHARVAIGGLTE